MEIIDQDRREEFIRYLGNIKDKKVVGHLDIVGNIHEGHRKILEKASQLCDILVVEYSEFWLRAVSYLLRVEKRISYTFKRFTNSLRTIEDKIDYVVYSPLMTNKMVNYLKFLDTNYKEDFFKLHNEIKVVGFASSLANQLHSEVADNCSRHFYSMKNIILDITMRKILPKDQIVYNPEIIWYIYRDPNWFNSMSRSSSLHTFGKMIIESEKEILNGRGEISVFEEIKNSYFLGNLLLDGSKMVSIVDLKEVKPLQSINDNCVVVFSATSDTPTAVFADFLFIKDGKLII